MNVGHNFDNQASTSPMLQSNLAIGAAQSIPEHSPTGLARDILRGVETETSTRSVDYTCQQESMGPSKAFPELASPLDTLPEAPQLDSPKISWGDITDDWDDDAATSPPARSETPAIGLADESRVKEQRRPSPVDSVSNECSPIQSPMHTPQDMTTHWDVPRADESAQSPMNGHEYYESPVAQQTQGQGQPLVAVSESGTPPTVLTGIEYDNAQQNMTYAPCYPMYSQVTTDGQYLYFYDYASLLTYQFQQCYATPQYSGPQITIPGVQFNQNATFNPQATGGFTAGYAKPLSPVVEQTYHNAQSIVEEIRDFEPARLGLQDMSSSESNAPISAA